MSHKPQNKPPTGGVEVATHIIDDAIQLIESGRVYLGLLKLRETKGVAQMRQYLCELVSSRRMETDPMVAATDKLVLGQLADCADSNGIARPTVAFLAEKCEIGEDTLRRSLKRLADAGYIRVSVGFRGDGGRSANAYIINRSRIEESKRVSLFHC
jgi:hypothetical protein